MCVRIDSRISSNPCLNSQTSEAARFYARLRPTAFSNASKPRRKNHGMTTRHTNVAMQLTVRDKLTVNRLGYGAMHLTGPGMWGDPIDPEGAIRVLRRAIDL